MYMYHECVHMEDTGQEIATGHLTFPNNLNKCPTILSLHVYHIHSTLHDRSKIIKSKQIIDLIFLLCRYKLENNKNSHIYMYIPPEATHFSFFHLPQVAVFLSCFLSFHLKSSCRYSICDQIWAFSQQMIKVTLNRSLLCHFVLYRWNIKLVNYYLKFKFLD